MKAALQLPAYSDEALAALTTRELLDLMVTDEDRVPRNVIDECARRGEEMVVHLAGLLDDGRHWKYGAAPGEWWLLLHAVMILGLMREERPALLLVQFMRRMAQGEDDNLQEWLAGYWPALFRNKSDCFLPTLRALCEDRGLDWYIRTNAVETFVSIAQCRDRAALDEALTWAAGIASNAQEDWTLRLMVGNILLDFPRAENRPLLEDLAKRQKRWGVHFSMQDVQEAYSTLLSEPEWERRADPWRGFYAPVAIELRQERWEAENGEADYDELDDEGSARDEILIPHVRAMPKVGRNDKCPCGSGRKYKKCCLLKDQASNRRPRSSAD